MLRMYVCPCRSRAADVRRELGYSMLELIVVLTIIVVIISISIFSLIASRRAYAVDDAVGQVMNVFREAKQRALSQRQVMRVRINHSDRSIQLIDENTIGEGVDDDEIVRDERLVAADKISYAAPEGVHPPASPFDFTAVVYDEDGIWETRFTSEGRIVDAASSPMSSTLFVYQVTSATDPAPLASGSIAAVTIFGPSASMRYWRYDNGTFVPR